MDARTEPTPSVEDGVPWIIAERLHGDYPQHTDGGGKWLVFVPTAHVDAVWDRVRTATEQGLLGGSSKVSTARPNYYLRSTATRVICVYTYDWTDEADVRRVRAALRELGSSPGSATRRTRTRGRGSTPAPAKAAWRSITSEPLVINGLPLPRELLDLIESGRWRCPTDQSGLDRLFPERSEFCCYSFGGMRGETEVIHRNDNPMWRGKSDLTKPPGDIDPKLAVLIADLGIGYDQPIALDYRPALEQPRVLTLSWGKPEPPIPWGEVQPWSEGKRRYDDATSARLREWYEITRKGGWNRWIEIAPDFKTFAALAKFL